MGNSTSQRFYLLNLKGRILRELILQLSDEELKLLFPSPSQRTIKHLKKKAERMSMMRVSQN